MNKISNRMGSETLQSCVKMSIEGPDVLEKNLVNDVVDLCKLTENHVEFVLFNT